MITPQNLVKHELIGLEVEIVGSSNKTHIGIRGLVVDETKNLLAIETAGGIKRVQKSGTEFVFKIPDGRRVKVRGLLIAKRHEDRIKIKTKKW